MCQHALSRPPTITDVLLAPVSTEIAFWHGMDRLVGDVDQHEVEGRERALQVVADVRADGARTNDRHPRRQRPRGRRTTSPRQCTTSFLESFVTQGLWHKI